MHHRLTPVAIPHAVEGFMRGHVRYRSGMPGPGVLVSDGRTVTTTGHDGSFSIEPRGPFVFVSRPAGTTCPTWFVPASTPEADFVLDAEDDVFPHRFVHISDTHLGAGPRKGSLYPQPVEIGDEAVFTRFLTRLPELEPGLRSVIATGDLTDLGLDEEYAALRNVVEASPLPLHLLPGNHDHMNGEIAGLVSRTGYALHSGDPAGYERHVGPRWYSFDLPGLHVVALDWHTHEIGLDHEIQDSWIRADLESISRGTPWVLLSHDQPWHSILDGLPSAPIATFSGHRHTSRVVQVGGTLHVNTPTPLFGALDYSPPSFRVVTWDGSRISLRTRSLDGPGTATFSMPASPVVKPDAVRWRHQLPGAGHRAPVRLAGHLVLVPVKDEDRAAGGVDALDHRNGSLRWRAELGSAVKGTPAVDGDIVIAVEVSGDVVGLDLADGTQLWRTPSPDPLRHFAFADPLGHAGITVVGDLAHLRGLDTTTGAPVWERRDLTPYQTTVQHAAPVIVGDTVVVGSWPQPQSLFGLDIATGETRWSALRPEPGAGVSIAAGDTSIGTPLVDDKTGDLFVAGLGFLARVDPRIGRSLWRRPMRLPWNPAAPVATDLGIAAVDSGYGVVLLDRDSGAELWSTRIGGTAPFAMSSYQRTPHAVFAGPTVLEGVLLVPGLDGMLHLLAVASGERLGGVEVGVPLAAPVVLASDTVVAVGVDGGVLGIDRARCGDQAHPGVRGAVSRGSRFGS
jgi:outer membrane protein assembly factor BamB